MFYQEAPVAVRKPVNHLLSAEAVRKLDMGLMIVWLVVIPMLVISSCTGML